MLHRFSVRSYDPRNLWFAIFGYMTVTLATFFVGRDAENTEAELAGAKKVAAGLLYLLYKDRVGYPEKCGRSERSGNGNQTVFQKG
jgi:hypothetical protein